MRVRYRKFNGCTHRDYPAWRLGEDQHGVWLGVTVGTASIYHGRPSVEQIPFVLLVPGHSWWTAMFNPPPRTSEVYCDVTSPAHWDDDHTVDLVDLDLDVVRRRHTGLVELLDEDEFAQRRVELGYPDEVVAPAQAAARWLYQALQRGAQPFASRYLDFLREVLPAQPAVSGTDQPCPDDRVTRPGTPRQVSR